MNINRIRNSKKHLIFLLLFIGFLFVSCSSSTKTQESENLSETDTIGSYDNTEYEEDLSEYEDNKDNKGKDDGLNVDELDYLTKVFYFGNSPDESEQAILDSFANAFINEDTPRDKYLITNNSAGYFRIDGTVKDVNDEHYKYKYHIGGINMVDAAVIAGTFLDENYDENDDEIDGCSMPVPDENAIIAFKSKYFAYYDENDPKNSEYEQDSTIYLIRCENSSSWYRKDSIKNIVIYSDLFKTAEGIGVGITFEELRKAYGKLYLHIGWIESEERVEVWTVKYPMIRFIFKEEDVINFAPGKSEDESESDYIDGWAGSREEDGSGFKPKSKIWRIIIDPYYVRNPDAI